MYYEAAVGQLFSHIWQSHQNNSAECHSARLDRQNNPESQPRRTHWRAYLQPSETSETPKQDDNEDFPPQGDPNQRMRLLLPRGLFPVPSGTP